MCYCYSSFNWEVDGEWEDMFVFGVCVWVIYFIWEVIVRVEEDS